jgi:DNA topoisomerase IB
MKLKDPKDKKDKQLATACYLIDKLALRVGNEKGEDEADTVGKNLNLKIKKNKKYFEIILFYSLYKF